MKSNNEKDYKEGRYDLCCPNSSSVTPRLNANESRPCRYGAYHRRLKYGIVETHMPLDRRVYHFMSYSYRISINLGVGRYHCQPFSSLDPLNNDQETYQPYFSSIPASYMLIRVFNVLAML